MRRFINILWVCLLAVALLVACDRKDATPSETVTAPTNTTIISTDDAVSVEPTEYGMVVDPTEGETTAPPTEGDVVAPPTEGDVIVPPTDDQDVSVLPPTDED